ncbi:MAG TPA: acetyl-CoA carboxylase biotin carboxyl carrier protein subunit [Oligoflexia bacterium]|nr:acetyl-CoA carboxylase biotin carboxyl carrier protein subunit [Oligoflexia bacterium]HMR24371.1 acetyl-CoA carboxylase biotin carboxyl carrier protein subunit [Oligoflexia bacterium]
MQRILDYQNQEWQIKLSFDPDQKTCSIDMDGTQLNNIYVQKLSHGYMFIHQHKVYTLYLIKQLKDSFELDINGQSIHCNIYNPKQQAGQNHNSRSNNDTNLLADMPGRVVKILVKEGQDVNLGDPLLVLEAMKMENELKSVAKVTIFKIHVQEGDSIDSGQTLIEFEKAS